MTKNIAPIALGAGWMDHIRAQAASGKYDAASEIVRVLHGASDFERWL